MYPVFKRAADIFLAVFLIVLLAPLTLLTAVLIRVNLGSPVIFTQERGGRGGRRFRIYKFRTMTDGRDAQGDLLPDEDRLTPFGRFLRKSSLDELPSLFNIIKGDMSFIGPRPLVAVYLDRYTEHQARRHEVRPGLTGLAAVRGRNTLTWAERFTLDVWYVENQSFWLDLKILLLTVPTAVSGRGTSAEGHATMTAFQGLTGAARTPGQGQQLTSSEQESHF